MGGLTTPLGFPQPPIGSNQWGQPTNLGWQLIDSFLRGLQLIPTLKISGDVTIGGVLTVGGITGVSLQPPLTNESGIDGTINGTNKVFALGAAPTNANACLLFVAGSLVDPANFTIAGTTLTFTSTTSLPPQQGDSIVLFYS